jgi:nickel-dependent lactate racemase
MLIFPWECGNLSISIPNKADPVLLEPVYPQALSGSSLIRSIQNDLYRIKLKLIKAERIVLIIEDSSRVSKTATIAGTICEIIQELRGNLSGFEIVLAAGAHFHIQSNDILNKIDDVNWPLSIHSCTDEQNLDLIGYSSSKVPLFFNRKVTRAGLRLAISTMNIHPLAGLSGGGKILLPGVAGLKTIKAFHSLPPGLPGVERSPMRDFINEALELIPITYSWHLISNPHGAIVEITGGTVKHSFNQAKTKILQLVTIIKPEHPAQVLILGCRPFNQNLIGTFKSLHHIPRLLQPGGRVIILNEARQGIGYHHWRTEPKVVLEQKTHYQQLLKDYQVAVFSPQNAAAQFQSIFPETFELLKSEAELNEFINRREFTRLTVVPYAPITLLK